MKAEIKMNKGIITVLMLISVITIGLNISYALFQRTVKLNNVVEIQTGSRLPKPITGLGKELLEYDIKTKEEVCNPTVEEDGITYLSGDNNCIDFNYVWYSGKLWKVTAINSDGTIKMITDDWITSISWGNSTTTKEFKDSLMYQFLNEDFKDTLYDYQNILETDYLWNVTHQTDYTKNIPKTDMINSDVGLLTSYEYYISFKNSKNPSTGYINVIYGTYTLTLTEDDFITLSNPGGIFYQRAKAGVFNGFGVRPAVVLKNDNLIASGKGTREDPYILEKDKSIAKPEDKLNTRISGEYVKFDNEVYRIVSVEEDQGKIIKLTKNEFLKDENGEVLLKRITNGKNQYGISEKIEGDYWDYYLNNTWYNKISDNYRKMMVKSIYYLGSGTNYKNTICSEIDTKETTKNCQKTTTTWEGYVGLPRIGEIFSMQLNDEIKRLWLISPSPYLNTQGYNAIVNSNAYLYFNSEVDAIYALNGVRPTITLSPDVIITSGDGRSSKTPYEISLP